MIFKRKSPEERLAEELAKELWRQVREFDEKMTPEQRERLKRLQKIRDSIWNKLEDRIGRGEVEVRLKEVDGKPVLFLYETFKNFPFKRYKDYLLLPSTNDGYFVIVKPLTFWWVEENIDTWRPRALAVAQWLDEPIKIPGYDGDHVVAFRGIIVVRDGRKFLAPRAPLKLVEEADGTKTARKLIAEVSAWLSKILWPLIKHDMEGGKITREEAERLIKNIPGEVTIDLAILKDLGIVV